MEQNECCGAEDALAAVRYGQEVVKALFPFLSGEALTECYRLVAIHGGYALHASLESISMLLRHLTIRTQSEPGSRVEYLADGSMISRSGENWPSEHFAKEIAGKELLLADAYAIVKWIYQALPQQPLLLAHFRCELDKEKRMLCYVPVAERVDNPIQRWQNKK